MSKSSDADLGVRLDGLARRAADGDRDALSELVREIQHPLYRLALRFLGNPDDAQDACQEILIRIVTRLGTFDGRSKFSTWAYTVAVRMLLRTRKRLYESAVQGAEQYAAALDAGLGDVDPTLEEVEYRLLSEEVRISCTYGTIERLPEGAASPRPVRPVTLRRVWARPITGAPAMPCGRRWRLAGTNVTRTSRRSRGP